MKHEGTRSTGVSLGPLLLAALAMWALASWLPPAVARAQEPPGEIAARARAARQAGQVEEARSLFVEAITTGDTTAADAAASWVGLARMLAEAGEPAAAAGIAEAGLRAIEDGLALSRDQLRYLAAIARRDAGDVAAAALGLREVVASGGALAPIARLRLAQTLVLDGRALEAVPAFRVASQDPGLTPALRDIARFEGADALEVLGLDLEAVELLTLVADDALSVATSRAVAHWRIAGLLRSADDPLLKESWTEHAHAALAFAPGAPVASEALADLEAELEPVEPLTAAYVHYLARRDGLAGVAYESVVADAPSALAVHTAQFYLAVIDERAGATESAIDLYRSSLETQPDGPLADDAAWWRAALLDGAGRAAEAAEQYQVVVADYPRSPFAADAALRGPLALIEDGDVDGGILGLSAIAEGGESLGDAPVAAEAARWLQVLDVPSGPDPTALAPGSLPALLAASATDARDPLPASAAQEWLVPAAPPATRQAEARAETDAWIAVRTGALPQESSAARDPRLPLLLALAEVGEAELAEQVANEVLVTFAPQAPDLITVARAASEAGAFTASIDAADRVLRSLPAAERCGAPQELLELAYPIEFAQDLVRSADVEGVPPLLLAAIVRQESRFNPRAGSVAGAVGLTQVIPPTGEAIAAALGVGWDPLELYRPATSLRFGAHYFGTQLTAFEGDVLAALAAYNAGPGNAEHWRDVQRLPGADGYLLAIDFPETRLYVQLVLENYGWYRCIYANAEAPAIR